MRPEAGTVRVAWSPGRECHRLPGQFRPLPGAQRTGGHAEAQHPGAVVTAQQRHGLRKDAGNPTDDHLLVAGLTFIQQKVPGR